MAGRSDACALKCEGPSGGGAVKIDMVSGSLWRKILMFSLPLIASGVLQQSFNSVDVAVVGRYCGNDALAAVGSNGVIISLIINLFVGIAVGANVVVSRYIGQKDAESIRRSVATVGVLALASGVALTLTGVCVARPILEAIDTPEGVLPLATVYLRLFFLGMPFMMAYNFGSAILRSLGDTRRPFYALIVGGVVNTLLNLLLVLVFDMSVAGVAIATVTAQFVSAAIVVVILVREADPFRLDLRALRVHRVQLRKILQIGVPAGLQGVVFSVSNVFVVGNINLFGATASAGSAAALIFEMYCYFVIRAFAQAAVAFTSANYGAGHAGRCNRVFAICMALSVVASGVLNVALVWWKEPIVSLFTTEPGAMCYAYERMTYVLLFQFVASSYEIAGACMRGLGYSMTPTVFTVVGTCVLRIIWVHTVTADATDFGLLMSVYPLSWCVTGSCVLIAYYVVRKRAYRIIVR